MLAIETNIVLVLTCCLVGLIYAIVNAIMIAKVKIYGNQGNYSSYNKFHDEDTVQDPKQQTLLELAHYIEKGSHTFIINEYKYIGVFCIIMAFIIFFAVESTLGYLWTTMAFLVGCLTSIIVCFISMRAALFSNYRCAIKAQGTLGGAFSIAYRAGCIMGFTITSVALLILTIIICIYTNIYIDDYEDYITMYECIAGFGLGGSVIALFGRVGGGIYTKASELGADLFGKIEENIPEKSPQNPGVIADFVGNNLGDVIGMGSDLYGSYTEALSAVLVIAASSPTFYYQPSGLFYPLLMLGFGIIVCVFTTTLAHSKKSESFRGISDSLKNQLVLSTLFVTPAIWLAGFLTLPDRLFGFVDVDRQPIHAWICATCGVWSSLIIGYISEYYTSHMHNPVKDVSNSTKYGAATNIIFGLSHGYASTVIPIIIIAVLAFTSHYVLGMFGIGLAAMGMLTTLSIFIAIQGYGPVTKNAAGLVDMSEFGEDVKHRTDALDAAGNQTISIGKGYSVAAAALVTLGIYGAFLTRSSKFSNNHPILSSDVNTNVPLILAGLIIGAMLPYAFSSLSIKSVGKVALLLIEEIKRQYAANPDIKTGAARPNYDKSISTTTKHALNEMFCPASLAIGIPFLVGVLFGPISITGIIIGVLTGSLVMALSSVNAGGIWSSVKKYIESGQFTVDGKVKTVGSNEHKASAVGQTVGSPLKDTTGPSLNILMKLSAMFALVFAGFFDKTAFLQCQVAPGTGGC